MRDDDLGCMQKAVLKSDGGVALLRWLARRLNGCAILFDPSGKPARDFTGCPPDVLRDAARDIRRVLAGEAAAASVCGPSWWARIARAGATGGPALLVTSRTPLNPDDGMLIAHAAALLELRWSADKRNKSTTAIREAVLHLLMAGDAGAARRVAGAMKPDLAALVRVYLVEGTAAARNAIADRCEGACGGQAWIVRCPVYRRHVIILSPANSPQGPYDVLLPVLQAACTDAVIGAGDTVALRDTAASYTQAYHALAVARHRPDHFACYTAPGDLAAVLGRGARPWARNALAPLLGYAPTRPQDLDSQELCATLRSWLDFRGAAWRQLKVNRDTLSARLQRIQAILERDLSRLPVQAELHLALQLLHRPDIGETEQQPDLDELLDAADAREWAKMTLAPLEQDRSPVLLETVRAWLATDAQAGATAATLRISARGVRYRIERAEERLGRSLTGGPSARHDVLLALRIRDRDARKS